MAENESDIRRELSSIIRQELQDLKHCQLQYFTIAITGTGAILGLSGISSVIECKGLALLAPLSIILPSWMIFFDKATSITRITGYQRILEEMLIDNQNQQVKYKYIGYENALAEFRQNEDSAWEVCKNDKSEKQNNLALLLTRHRYWIVNWLTFLILSLICLLGAYALLSTNNKPVNLTLPLGVHITAPQRTIWTALPFVLVTISLIYNLWLLFLLMHGRLSYNNCAKIWRYILDINRKN
jgi:hypothetical protein